MIKCIWTSDLHIGLKTDEIDRTDEIESVTTDVIKYAVKLKKEGHTVILVIGGDLFDKNNPSEKYVAVIIRLLKLIKKHNIKTFIMVGNHDAIFDPERLSCLSFIKELKHGYPSVELVEDVKMVKVGVLETGPMYFTFLPHITRATIQAKVKDNKLKESLTPQQYIEAKTKRIVEKIGQAGNNIAFSHLNVSGAHPGSEENLLKRSDVFVPQILLDPPIGYSKTMVVQGHIHTNQMVGENLYIIGSPIFCSFGEKIEPKYFAEINIPGEIGQPNELFLHETKYRPFYQLELNMVGQTGEFFEIPEVVKFLETLDTERKPVVKLDIAIDPECNNYQWSLIREKIAKDYNCFVKNIVPRIIVKRQVRSADQKINLTPKKAVQTWLTKNFKKNPKKARKLYALSLKYLGE